MRVSATSNLSVKKLLENIGKKFLELDINNNNKNSSSTNRTNINEKNNKLDKINILSKE